MRGRSPDGSIESDIRGLTIGGAGLNVTAAFAFCLGARTTPRLAASEPVYGGVYIAGRKYFPGFCFFAAFPPVGITGIENILLRRFRRCFLLGLLVRNSGSYLTGFFFSSDFSSSGAG